jgi:signal transduction histidine kinase
VLRLAHKRNILKDPAWLLAVLGLFLFSACQPSDKAAVDKLNTLSYAYHYRNIDSTALYARQALGLSSDYGSGRAEALANLAFISLVSMNYAEADSLLDEAIALTDNQVELLVCYVQQMRLCQRRSENRQFYEWREQAVSALKRINEERSQLSEHQRKRLAYAESEMAIVTSTYYYYVGLERQSVEALRQLNADEVRHDTAQYINYLYNIGAGGVLTEGTPEQIHQEEINYLNRCLSIAERNGYVYFEAQAKEALADHTANLQQAEEALRLFKAYGDVYQIAGAYRTLASCYHAMEDDASALLYLDSALIDPRINQAPDLVASIREQLSVAYSAVNDKPNSDYNRNIYIDLQEQTRQDRELEARAGLLDHAVNQLNLMIWAVLGAIVLLLFFLWLFNHLNRKQKEDHELDDLLVEKNEQVAEARLRVEKNERRQLEQRAKISLAMSILPLIDRILHEVKYLDSLDNLDHPDNQESLDYIRELTDNINAQNDLLTQWIQLRQGELNLHIESFPLQQLFDMVARSKTSFAMKGVTLHVESTVATVKADRVLTLFMLNTLADNARKFTAKDGQVNISAQEQADFVEISVSDTGCGMSQEVLDHVFDHKTITDKSSTSHGFGLMNCKGIIEKYRKISQIFSVCQLQAESEQGRGSRFYFRLPKGVQRLILIALLSTFNYQLSTTNAQTALDSAHVFADSAYFSNINGTYARTLQFADSCRHYLNAHYIQQNPDGHLLMTRQGDLSSLPSEIQWYHDSLPTNYQIVLDIRNESAVAALALHQWQLYAYNNKVYTQLFKEMSADNTLADYCRTMQQSQTNKRIAVILLLVLLVLIVPAYYMLYYRHRLYERFHRERTQQNNIEMAEDELRRAELEDSNLHVANAVLDNCLSTLKHETMYYPSRIQQLMDVGDIPALREVISYYRDLYGILIRQATEQVDRIKLHVRPVSFYGQQVLGDENLLRYLFELLKGTVEAEVKDDKYVAFHVTLYSSQLSTFTSLLARQIVRDHGEATNRRGCGITSEDNKLTVILPRYNGKI